MIAWVSLVLAVVVGGSEAHVLGYSSILPQFYTGAPISTLASPAITYGNAQPLVYNAVASPVTYSSVQPVVYNAAPSVAVVPQTSQSQYHSQDELGGYSFGHSGGDSSRTETRDHFGNVVGSYNYVDAEGKVQTTHYTAGPAGFQVAATNLPVALDHSPQAVEDTLEVAQAKSAFKAAFEKASAKQTNTQVRKKRSVILNTLAPAAPLHYSGLGPVGHVGQYVAGYSPVAYSGAIAPLAYSGATTGLGVRNAELLRVHNNPGHAVSYRVY